MDMILADRPGAGASGLRLAVTPSPAGIGEAQPTLRACLEANGVAASLIVRVELVFEEVVMNISMHGFDDPQVQTISVAIACGPAMAEMTFEDRGRPFDPVATAPRPMDETFDEDRPGGLGLRLIQQMATSLAYERLPEGINRLRAVFRD